MITREELKEYAKRTGLNLGQAEKDYFQTIILFILYHEYGTELIFKGGTALKKCYGLNRFSEDIDFTSENKIDIKKIENGLKRFNIEYEIKTKEYDNEQKTMLRVKGPLFIGIRQSLCKLIIDISLREKVVLKPNIKTIGRFLEEIPTFDIFAMQEKEILAEKIRAIMTRSKARDIYDLWFLMEQDVEFDKKLAKEKLKFYKEKWDAKGFADKIDMKKTIWENELKYLLSNVPDFQKTKESIFEKMKIVKHPKTTHRQQSQTKTQTHTH